MSEPLTLEQIRDFKGKYPRLIWPLFFSEMWERFSFYGMRGMLTFFMVNKLYLDKEVANLQYGATQAFVYALTFLGGMLADKILGLRRSLFWGGILMIIGSIILAIDPERFFFTGIGFNIIGTGFFKPNISSMVGNLYRAGDNRIDAGFSLFYAGVNLGGLFGGYLCIAVAKREMLATIVPEHLAWNVAFGFSSLFMIISLLTFIRTQKKLASIGVSPLQNLPPKKRYLYEIPVFIASLILIPVVITMVAKTEYTDVFMYIIGPASVAYLLFEMRNYGWEVNKKLLAALLFMVFSIFFWAFFEQSGGSLSLFAASNLSSNISIFHLDPNGVNNSANSFFVIPFAILFGIMWLWLGKRKLEPNTIVKFGLGFLFLAAGFYVFFLTRLFTDENGVTSLGVFTFGWLIITFGEVCLSPIGMSVMTRLSPQRLQAVVMGMWFLASAYGQYFAGLLGADIAKASKNMSNYDQLMVYTGSYKDLGVTALIVGVIVIAISPFMKKMMGDVK